MNVRNVKINSNKNLENYINPNQNKYEDGLNRQLYYEIKISKKKTIILALSINNYKQQFQKFIKQNNLSKQKAIKIKQLIKENLNQYLEKIKKQQNIQEEDHISFQQIVQKQSEEQQQGQYQQNNVYRNQQKVEQQNNDEIIQKVQPFLVNRKLFESQIEHSEEQQNQVYFQHQFSSIHQLDRLQDDYNEQISPTIQIYEQDPQELISTNVGTSRPTYFFQEYQNQDDLRIQQKRQPISSKQKRSFFHLQNDYLQMPKLKNQQSKLTKPIKNNKKQTFKQTKQIQLEFKINKDKSQSKSKNKKYSSIKKQQEIQKQKQLNHNIFYRLHKQQTQNFKQKFTIYQKPHWKQLRDQRIVSKFRNYHNQQFKHLTLNQKIQIFDKLHKSPTQSSLNKKYDPNYKLKQNIYELNQIQNVINLTAKKNHQESIHQKNNSASIYQKRTPNMNSKVYQSPIKKSCNEHCQQFQYEKKITQQKQKNKQKQKKIKDQIKSKSKQSNSSISPNKIKKSGECPCCHHHKIQKQKIEKQKNQRKKQRSYTSNTKYSIQKLFPPYNHTQSISHVLQESYNQLFPKKYPSK